MKLKLFLSVVSFLFALGVFTTVVLAQEEPPPPYTGLKNPFPWNGVSAQETGKGLFQQSCQGCHGASGGNIAKADFRAGGYPQKLEESPGLYFWILSEGRLDKGMPAYKSSLSEEQRWQVLTYLWSLGTAAPAPEVTLPSKLEATLPSKSDAPLDCLSCHARVLQSHDKLGEGSKACWVCHDSTTIGQLRLVDGTQLPLESSPQLCGQCHTSRYEAWQKGGHGILNGKTELDFLGDRKLKCVSCHNPHQPKIEVAKLSIPSLPTFESGAPLDCLGCHARVLEGHDKLGSGSKACWACHYNKEMGVLHLATGEERLTLSDYPQLCAQCHQKRYEAWSEGTHAAPLGYEGTVTVHGVQRVGCISCHDPHRPQMAFTNITKPHPVPAPLPPPPPVKLLVVFGISLLVVTTVGIVLAKKGAGV